VRILSLASRTDLEQELGRVGADSGSWPIFAAKAQSLAISINRLSTAGANILKQTALACGADCAVHTRIVSGRKRLTDAVLFATERQLGTLAQRLGSQPECASRLVPELNALVWRYLHPDLSVRILGKDVDLGARAFVMGILNVTPDSFYDGGRHLDKNSAIAHAEQMAAEGADFIDIGAESTRPGARPVPDREQLARLLPVFRVVRKRVRAWLSVDTTSARVAQACLDAGADMVNDISGLSFDRRMAKVIAKNRVPCCIMHIKGRPRTMQRRPKYEDLMAEVTGWLRARLEYAVAAGVEQRQVIVDPGLGFGKTVEHNLEIIRRLTELRSLGRPILVGPSRKSFVGKVLGLGPEERLEGSLAACVLASRNGANVLRVHDVKPAVRALRLADAVRTGMNTKNTKSEETGSKASRGQGC